MNKITLGLIFLVLIIIFFQYEKIKILESENKFLQSQFDMLKIASEQEKKHVEEAHKIAEKESLKSAVEVKKILNDKVSSNCHAAIQWGIEQARKFGI